MLSNFRKKFKLFTNSFMNFFSHYYLDKENINPWYKFGILLPELFPHYNQKLRKAVTIYAEKNINETHKSIYKGIQRHYEVDKLFHNSDFFRQKTEIIKLKIIENQQLHALHYRTFFLAHIWLELLIDRTLIVNDTDNEVERFYEYLESIDIKAIQQFFTAIQKEEMLKIFIDTFERNLRMKFLHYYLDNEKLIRALLRLYSKANHSIFDMNVSRIMLKLLLLLEHEMKTDLLNYMYEFKTSLKQTTT